MKLLIFCAIFVVGMTLNPNDTAKKAMDLVKVKAIRAIQQNENLKSGVEGMN